MGITIGFVGIGLIGGSIAKILKKKREDIRIIAFNRSEAPLKLAIEEGVVDKAVQIDESFLECDYIFLCTPVEYNSQYLTKLKPFIKEGCIVTDVGSVKGYIHKTVGDLDMEDCFIGGHPMAGSEKTGYANSSEGLLENAFYAITPTEKTSQEMLDKYVELVKLTDAIPVVLKPDEHDYSVAGISHVPHVIASSLVNLVKHSDNSMGTMKLLAAGGFKDITRIASSSPEMWEQICATNAESISSLLGDYITYLNEIKTLIDNRKSSEINDFFGEAREYRNSVADGKKGPILGVHFIHCNIQDKEGALLEVISKLTANHINLKNVEIVNNRTAEDGVLKIMLESEADKLLALEILGDQAVR